MKQKILAIGLVAATLMAINPKADACTGIQLKTKAGNTVMARTIEWSGTDMNHYYVVVPRGHEFKSFGPDGTALCSKVKYAYAGVSVEQPEFVMEGINEKGLSAGLFYFPDYGRYEEYKSENKDSSVSDFQLVSYILSCCSNVDEVKEAIGKIHIHSIDPRSSTVHWRFIEEGGRQIVLEIIDGKYVFYENTVGTLTNSPSFDWQVTNLNNYVNMQPGRVFTSHIGELQLNSFGGGSGFLGIPGDFTGPSRFVRATLFASSAPKYDTALQTVVQAFHILNNFDIPIGAQYANGETPAPIPSATQITVASDLSGRKLYYRTMNNCEIRCIDFNRINFKKLSYTVKPLDEVKKETIHQLF